MRKLLIATVTVGLFFSSVALAGPSKVKPCSVGTSSTQAK